MPHEILNRLLTQTFDQLSREEKLAFLERLFKQLPTQAQQEFLLEVAARIISRPWPGRWRSPMGHRGGPPPWAFCLQMMQAYEQEAPTTVPPARLFAALADENRLKIVKALSEGPQTVDELVKLLNLSQSTVSHHLRILKEAGVLTMEKRGRNSVYALNEAFSMPESAGETDTETPGA